MLDFAYIFNYWVGSSLFLLITEIVSLAFKVFISISLLLCRPNNSAIKKLWFLLILILFSASLSDITWIVKLIREICIPTLPQTFLYLCIRVAWAFTVVLHQSIALFITYLAYKNIPSNFFRKISIAVSLFLFIVLWYYAIFCFNLISVENRKVLEIDFLKIIYLHTFILLIPTVIGLLRNMKKMSLPHILKRQVLAFIKLFILPYLLLEFFTANPFDFSLTYQMGNYCVISISTLFLTYVTYYCTKTMVDLRFLNFKNHVQANKKFNFIDEFSYILEQLSVAESASELSTIAQNFFKTGFSVPPSMVRLVIRGQELNGDLETREGTLRVLTENFLAAYEVSTCNVGKFMRSTRVLITDELEFSNFYEGDKVAATVIEFLKSLQVDLFIPLYDKQNITAYVIVDQGSRPQKFFSSVERDEMLIFASYLSNTLNLLQQSNLQELLHQEKELKDEIYAKHQEINQYKESIRSLLKNKKENKIGIVFYKNKHFTFANQAAHDIIVVDLNIQEGHRLTRACKKITQNVLHYNTAQTINESDNNGNRIVLSAMPSTENNAVLITVYYPDVTDVIVPHLDFLRDPSEWDYLLYLETTESGQLINQLFPGFSAHLIELKIKLLKAALSNRPALLMMPADDLTAAVELIHHISLRKRLHIIRLSIPEKNLEVAIKLFGINRLFASEQSAEPLLAQLQNSSTLFIENVHFLSLETQEQLSYFIRYGFFKSYKGTEKFISNAHIIVSTPHDLDELVQEKKFSAKLAEELQKNKITMPSLLTLSHQELETLTESLAQQAVTNELYKPFLQLTEKEKNKLLEQRPTSINELRIKVQQLLSHKSEKQGLIDETHFDPAYYVNDPEIMPLVRLGKHALKDAKIMALLWRKFKNQNKIATLLGVNRSSVNRRCKDYHLL